MNMNARFERPTHIKEKHPQLPEHRISSEQIFADPKLAPFVKHMQIDSPGELQQALRYIDIPAAEHTTTPNSLPVVFFEGFGGKSTDYGALKSLAESGQRVVAPDHEFGISHFMGDLRYDHEQHLPDHHLEELLAVTELIDRLDIDRVDLFAHSEGALHAVIMAILYPERVGNIVLYNPAGLVGPQSSMGITWDFIREGIAQVQTPEGKQFVANRANYSGPRNHSLDVWRQRIARVSDIAQGDITDALRYIKQTQDPDSPSKIALITSINDKVFSPQDIEKNLASHGHTFGDIADIAQTIPGNHSSLFQEPQQFASVVPELLKQMHNNPAGDNR